MTGGQPGRFNARSPEYEEVGRPLAASFKWLRGHRNHLNLEFYWAGPNSVLQNHPASQLLADVASFCRRDVTRDVFVEQQAVGPQFQGRCCDLVHIAHVSLVPLLD